MHVFGLPEKTFSRSIEPDGLQSDWCHVSMARNRLSKLIDAVINMHSHVFRGQA